MNPIITTNSTIDINSEKPQFLVSVFINENNEIEETEILQCFIPGESGRIFVSDEYVGDYSLKNSGLLDFCEESNTLYHVYLRLDWYKSSYEYEEWDCDIVILRVVQVMSNYREQFINIDEEYIQQEELKAKDEPIEDFDTYGWNYNKVNVSQRDLSKFILTIAQSDIQLAHRFIASYDNHASQEVLGDLFDPHLHQVERKRLEFKRYVKSGSDLEVYYTDNGYRVSNKRFILPSNNSLEITFEEVDNISDEILLNYSFKEIIEHFYNSKAIFETFDSANEVGEF